MGVPGLAKFISNRSYFTPIELRDTHLVIDGNGCAMFLFVHFTRTYSAFGGDYDAYQQVVKDFFTTLKKCNITPIVIFDGGHEKKKLRTMCSRNTNKFHTVLLFQREFSTAAVTPMFTLSVFNDVVKDLGIVFNRYYLEADGEIAAVAHFLNCPVLSFDTDFIFFHVKYIPFTTVDLPAVKVIETGLYILKCSYFNVEALLSDFKGLGKPELILVPAVIGNDYMNGNVFEPFMNHVPKRGNENRGWSQKKIEGFFNWLKSEDVESAEKLILKHITKRNVALAQRMISATKNHYKVRSPSKITLCKISQTLSVDDGIGCDERDLYDKDFRDLLNVLPSEFLKKFGDCSVQPQTMDLVFLKCYCLPVIIEDLSGRSCHAFSLPIISAMNHILHSYLGKEEEVLIFTTVKGGFVKKPLLPFTISNCFAHVQMKNLSSEPVAKRSQILYSVLNLEADKTVLQHFNKDWSLFVMCIIYWLKNLKSTIHQSHVHAMLFMTFFVHIQSKVGYFGSLSQMKKCNFGKLKRLSKREVNVNENNNNNKKNNCELFSEVFDTIPNSELLNFVKRYMSLRNVTDGIRKDYSIKDIHLYNTFQSCLFYILALNELLDYPFESLRIGNFYCGTFLINILHMVKNKRDVTGFVLGSLTEFPNIKCAYEFFHEQLVPYILNNERIKDMKVKKRKKRKRQRYHGK